jgi:hypothetical protein
VSFPFSCFSSVWFVPFSFTSCILPHLGSSLCVCFSPLLQESVSGNQLALTLTPAPNTKGAFFALFDLNNPSLPPKKLTVGAGDSLSYFVSADTNAHRDPQADQKNIEVNNNYNYFLYGPNGFVRQFAGNSPSVAPACSVSASYDLVNGYFVLTYTNTAPSSPSSPVCVFQAVDNAYKTGGPWSVTVSPSETATQKITVTQSGNWYDVSVYVDVNQNTDKMRRYMGRIERAGGTSDPAMDASSPFFASARPLHPTFQPPTSHPTLEEILPASSPFLRRAANKRYKQSRETEKMENKDSRRCFGGVVDQCDVEEYYSNTEDTHFSP